MSRLATLFSSLSLLAFVERAILDWRFVPEMIAIGTPWPFAGASAFYMAVLVWWLWALVGTSHRRRRAIQANLAVNAFVVVLFGLGTTLVWCPTPCRTAWPLLEIGVWANTGTGLLAIVACVAALRDAQEVA